MSKIIAKTINGEKISFSEPTIGACLHFDSLSPFDQIAHYLAIASGKPVSFFMALKVSQLDKLSKVVNTLNESDAVIPLSEPTIEHLCLLAREGEEVGTIRHTMRLYGLCRLVDDLPAPVKAFEGFADYPYSFYLEVKKTLDSFRDDEDEDERERIVD